MDEARALKLCIEHRDPVGFEFLVGKYRREAYLHALALLGNREDAIDACQDSFANAFAALPRLGALTAFYPWFYRVLRNCCLNRLARRRTELEHAREALDSEPECASGPDAALSLDEERARVWEVLAELSLEHREILALKYLRDYDYETLAALLGIPRGTVMSRLYHARKAFQAAYTARVGGFRSTER